MKTIELKETLTAKAKYDLIVAGGGVSGVAAALTAKKRGLSVLLLEKSNILGGLATLGLVNYFVSMCNGRGKQIVFGLADKWFRGSTLYGYDSMPDEWRNGEPKEVTDKRMVTRYSPYIFAMQLTEDVKNAGVDLLFDCIASEPVMEGKRCVGVVTVSKSGREFYEADAVIDATGDCDLLRQGGVPVVLGKNYYTYGGKKITLDSCRDAIEKNDIRYVYKSSGGGTINLYGKNQPADKPLWSGTTVEEVTDYLVDNQICFLNKLKGEDRKSRDVAMMPLMPNFRTTCRIDGDYTLKEEDKYKHFADSVCAINDFDRRDVLYEIPLRAICRKDYPNMLASGRSVSASGYAWDVTRVIPPAILTGQAAAEAAALSIESKKPVSDVDIALLQKRLLEDDNVMIHFPDEYVPKDTSVIEMGITEE